MASALAQIRDLDCECRAKFADAYKRGFEFDLSLLQSANDKIIGTIQGGYLQIVADLKQEIRIAAGCVAGLITLVAVLLVIDRGGIIAWVGLFAGVGLLLKLWLRPSRSDFGASVGLAVIFALLWSAVLYYVISTWESGEVVELAIQTNAGGHTARVWVLDIESQPVIYYDAEPEVAKSLLAGKPLQLLRSGQVSTRIPKAIPIDALSEGESNLILAAMEEKYGNRNGAAVIWYALLGSSRDRVSLIAYLMEE